jgi:hypothetical protein
MAPVSTPCLWPVPPPTSCCSRSTPLASWAPLWFRQFADRLGVPFEQAEMAIAAAKAGLVRHEVDTVTLTGDPTRIGASAPSKPAGKNDDGQIQQQRRSSRCRFPPPGPDDVTRWGGAVSTATGPCSPSGSPVICPLDSIYRRSASTLPTRLENVPATSLMASNRYHGEGPQGRRACGFSTKPAIGDPNLENRHRVRCCDTAGRPAACAPRRHCGSGRQSRPASHRSRRRASIGRASAPSVRL